MKVTRKTKFQLRSIIFTVYLDQSLILVAANDNPPANLAMWSIDVQKEALKALGEAQ